MSKYAVEHAGALADIAEAGAPITFTKTTNVYDATTDTSTTTTATVSGHAMKVRGRPDVYESLSLVESTAPTLLFAATTYGQTPELGATCTWASEAHTVRDVEPLAPDGTGITFRVVVSR